MCNDQHSDNNKKMANPNKQNIKNHISKFINTIIKIFKTQEIDQGG